MYRNCPPPTSVYTRRQGHAYIFSDEYRRVPLNITIKIDPNQDGRFSATLHTIDQYTPAEIPLTINELQARNNTFRDLAGPIRNPGRLREEEIEELVYFGREMFRTIFSDNRAQTFFELVLDNDTTTFIQIVSNDFQLPWEFMCPVGPRQQASVEDLWGMNHIISRKFSPQGTVSLVFDTSKPVIALLADNRLRAVNEREIPFFTSWHSRDRIQFVLLETLNPGCHSQQLERLSDFLAEHRDVVHLSCHAANNTEDPLRSALFVSDRFQVTLGEMITYDMHMNSAPLAIMNACETASLNPLFASNFVKTFLDMGCRGVVATEVDISDRDAAEVAMCLYKKLLEGEPLGKSLLAARRCFWETQRSLTPLIYSMYASPSTRFLPPVAPHQQGQHGP